MAVTESDCLIGLGTRFSDRSTGKVDDFSPQATKIHVDVDPTSISKAVAVEIPIVGDVKRVLCQMLERIEREDRWSDRPGKLKPWLAHIDNWERIPSYGPDEGRLRPQYVVERIFELTRGEAVVATEVGQNQMWTAQHYPFSRPRRFLTSGGLGTMGYGFPAAIGAQVAFPEATVIDIAGDGSIQMNIQELATAVEYRLPVKVAILNNGYLGMVRQWQEVFYGRRYSHSRIAAHPDFVMLAEAYGAVGLSASRPSEVDCVLQAAIAERERPVLIDFKVVEEENVVPMVQAGKSLNDMLLRIA